MLRHERDRSIIDEFNLHVRRADSIRLAYRHAEGLEAHDKTARKAAPPHPAGPRARKARPPALSCSPHRE